MANTEPYAVEICSSCAKPIRYLSKEEYNKSMYDLEESMCEMCRLDLNFANENTQ